MLNVENVPIRHETRSSHFCLSGEKETRGQTGNPSEAIARELLTYLAHLPARLHKQDLEVGELALMLGNALVWLHQKLDGNKPEIETAIGENPHAIYALGKQFQSVGRAAMDGKTPQQVTKAEYQGVLNLILEQGKQLDTIEKTLSLLVLKTEKGGGK